MNKIPVIDKSDHHLQIINQRIKSPQFKYLHTINIDKNLLLNNYKNLRFFVRTYGCQANIIDSETISKLIIDLGFKKADKISEANLIILNTCAIRENAEKKVIGEIGLINKYRKNHDIKVVICGCMSHEEKIINELIKLDNVNLIIGTHNIDKLPQDLYEIYKNDKKIIDVKNKRDTLYKILPRDICCKYKAFVTIMEGCNNFCTYCIVPFTRGRQISRPKDDIINEIKTLINSGVKEITLIGQNVNAYGIDCDDNYFFNDLLIDVAKLNVERIRFSTSNPWNFNKNIIDTIKKYPNIMPHIHLPIQSGDEAILRKMNRKMNINDYIDLIKYIRSNISDVAITTDLIVGFPNESKKQFKNTLKFYKKIKFDNAYSFIYSKRDGTIAAKIADTISSKEKEKRLCKLNKLVKKYAKFNNKKYVKKILDVMVEGISKTNSNVLTGYSPQLKVVNFTGIAHPGETVKVRITKANRFSLFGEKIN